MKPPIDILHLFPELNRQLINFLKELPIGDWNQYTVAKKWRVKDVVAHLLDGNNRQISLKRDGWTVEPDVEINSYGQLIDYLNRFNADWVKAAWRMSPGLLIEQLEKTNEEVYSVFKKLDPFGQSIYSVGWAGESVSYNWFDIAREYTERWLHQQQIRHAVGDTGIITKELYHPCLHIFMQAWPFACANADAPEGSMLKTVITGEGGGEWFLVKEKKGWKFSETGTNTLAAETTIDGNTAWILFSKSVRKENIPGKYSIKGDQQLGERVLDMVSVMA
jgi:hypothetical protein